MSRVVQVSFTDKEFADLERLAQEEGVTVPFYIKSKVLEDTEFQQWFQELLIRTGRIRKILRLTSKAVFQPTGLASPRVSDWLLEDRFIIM